MAARRDKGGLVSPLSLPFFLPQGLLLETPMKSIRSVHLAVALSASLILGCEVTEDPTTPTGPSLSMTAPMQGAVIKDGLEVTVSYDVMGVALAPAGMCNGVATCGHAVAYVDGTKCNAAKATNAWSGADKTFTLNFANCSAPWGSHQINVELVSDSGDLPFVDSRNAPASAYKGVKAVPTYSGTVQKILSAKCAPCHTAGGAGGHNIASAFADAKKDFMPPDAAASADVVKELAPCVDKKTKTVGDCAPLLVQSGAMPKGAGCTGDPTKDATKSACLTAAEQSALSTWSSSGLPEN